MSRGKIEPREICDSLHGIADLIALDAPVAKSEVLELVRRVAAGIEPPLDARERIELLAGRDLIAAMRGQLQESRWAVDRLSSHGCEILERLIAAGARIEIHDPRA